MKSNYSTWMDDKPDANEECLFVSVYEMFHWTGQKLLPCEEEMTSPSLRVVCSPAQRGRIEGVR